MRDYLTGLPLPAGAFANEWEKLAGHADFAEQVGTFTIPF